MLDMFGYICIVIMTTKIKFRKSVLTKNKVKQNILSIWNQSTEADKYDWYKEANQLANKWSIKYKIELPKVCGVIAALSPLKSWDENKRISEAFIKGNRRGHTNLFISKAASILDTDTNIESILRGSKIVSFYRNILQPDCDKFITIDRHSLSIAVGLKMTDESMKMTAPQYNFFVACYRELAKELNISPVLLQSTTWLYWRRINTNVHKDKIEMEEPF